MQNFCNCGNKISKNSIRCKSCANRGRKGEKRNPLSSRKGEKRKGGWHHSNYAKEKIRMGHLNEKNHRWTGDDVSYYGVHSWIRRRKLKPEFCEKCKLNKPYELANISGEYKRDVNDFRYLCRSCHSKEHRGKEWHELMYNKRILKGVTTT